MFNPDKLSDADTVRLVANRDFVLPARRRGDRTITLRAGDVHRAANFHKSNLPNVCQALESKIFCREHHLRLIRRVGPHQGANVFFTYEILNP